MTDISVSQLIDFHLDLFLSSTLHSSSSLGASLLNAEMHLCSPCLSLSHASFVILFLSVNMLLTPTHIHKQGGHIFFAVSNLEFCYFPESTACVFSSLLLSFLIFNSVSCSFMPCRSSIIGRPPASLPGRASVIASNMHAHKSAQLV